MKRITIWATALVAALAMTAVIGVASASAGTVLCSEVVAECPEGKVSSAGDEIMLGTSPASEGYFRVNMGFAAGTVDCETALVGSTSTMRNGNPLPGQSDIFVNSKECVNKSIGYSGSCSSTTFSEPKTTFEATGAGAGIIKLGSASEPLTFSITCYSLYYEQVLECSYKANGAIPIHYQSGEATILKSEAKTTKVSGTNCGSSGSIEAELLDAHGSTGISTATGTVLCTYAETICANNHVLPSGSILPLGVAKPVGEGFFKIKTALLGLECEYMLDGSTTLAESGNPLPAQSSFYVSPKTCGIGLWTGNTMRCEKMSFNSPAETIVATGGGDGVIYVGSKSEPLTVSYACYSPPYEQVVECSYKADSSVPIHYPNWAEAWISKEESALTRVSGESTYCPATGSLEAKLSTGGIDWSISSV